MSSPGGLPLFGGLLKTFNFNNLSPDPEPDLNPPLVAQSDTANNNLLSTWSGPTDVENIHADTSSPEQDSFPQPDSAPPSPATVFDFSAEPQVPAPEYTDLTALTALTSNYSNVTRSLRDLSVFFNRRRRAAIQGPLKGGASGWIDQDDSGTYDPAQKLKRLTPPNAQAGARRTKRKRGHDSDTEDYNEVSKEKSFRKDVGYGLMMVFSFVKPASKHYLQSIASGPMEEYSSDTDSDGDSGYGGSFERTKKPRKCRKRKQVDTFRRSDGLTIESLTLDNPQIRGCRSCFNAADDRCTLITEPQNYPCEACSDAGCDCIFILTPLLKKSCETCKTKRRECSYKKDGGRGQEACDYCSNEDTECPAAPLVLESAYGRRFKTEEEKGKLNGNNLKKVKNKKSASETTILDSHERPKERDRLYRSCNQCRYDSPDNPPCNISWESTGPCRNCKKNNDVCQFVWRPKPRPDGIPSILNENSHAPLHASDGRNVWNTKGKRNANRAGGPKTPDHQSRGFSYHTPRSTTAQLGKEMGKRYTKYDKGLLQGRAAGLIEITTAFCHPISLNWEAAPSPINSPIGLNAREKSGLVERYQSRENECSFCNRNSPLFGLYGLGEKGPLLVTGYWPGDGKGFEEDSGGFAELGEPPTRMCISCTTSRLNIVSCPMHSLAHLTSLEQNPLVFNDAAWYEAVEKVLALTPTLSSLPASVSRSNLVLDAKYCAICTSLAKHKCCSNYSKYFDDSGVVASGCGLLLCEECGELLTKFTGGGMRDNLLAQMIRMIEDNTWRYVIPIRADASFLTIEGELVTRMRQIALIDDKKNNFQDYLSLEAKNGDRKDRRSDLDTGVSNEEKQKCITQPDTTSGQASKRTPQAPAPLIQEPKKDKGKGKDWSYFSPTQRPSEFHPSSSNNNSSKSFDSPFTKKAKPAHKITTYEAKTYTNPYASSINTLSTTSNSVNDSSVNTKESSNASQHNHSSKITNPNTTLHKKTNSRRTTSTLLQPKLQKTGKASSFGGFPPSVNGNGGSIFGPYTSSRSKDVGLGIGMGSGASGRADRESGRNVETEMLSKGAVIDLTASDDEE